MKTLLTITFICMLGTSISAQITLEKAYRNHSIMQVAKLENEGFKYFGFDSAGTNLLIYNSDHTLLKQIPLTTHPYYKKASEAKYPSRYLFNSDAKMEVLVTYYLSGPMMGNSSWSTELIDEDGKVLQTFADETNFNLYKINGSWKLLNYTFTNSQTNIRSTYISVYSLPGQYAGQLKTSGVTKEAEAMLYPNPFAQQAMLRYDLPAGTTDAQADIYNAAGALLRSYKLSNRSSAIMIDRADLPTGIYTYRISAPGYTSASDVFIIQ